MLSGSKESHKKPNILFVIVDDLRPEMGCYGNPDIKTPHFDAFARKSMLFANAYCQNASCAPSRASGHDRLAAGLHTCLESRRQISGNHSRRSDYAPVLP
ncbi:MAG: sulfatase-like hydrolase/transferase [Planctomycetes bacterium]|nr:sulfatase-like hydrolase/transferase [Planctomycetota bacterium]MBL7189985.1 sulfatase-like hydrolase/transferase [Phycisphaerae bacterium]